MMQVTLSEELEHLIATKINSGQYASAGEVIRDALHLLEEHDRLQQEKLRRLKKDLALGLDQAERGQTAPLDMKAIKAKAREEFSQEAS